MRNSSPTKEDLLDHTPEVLLDLGSFGNGTGEGLLLSFSSSSDPHLPSIIGCDRLLVSRLQGRDFRRSRLDFLLKRKIARIMIDLGLGFTI